MSLFVFRRDLRLYDNTSLLQLIDRVQKNPETGPVYPVFIFNEQQIGKANFYRSINAISFMIKSLAQLSERVPLNCYRSDSVIGVLDEIAKKTQLHAVAFNRDYTPYSKERDGLIEKWCRDHKVELVSSHDALLSGQHLDLETKSTSKPYNTFTHFRNRVLEEGLVESPRSFPKEALELFARLPESPSRVDLQTVAREFTPSPDLYVKGGRREGLDILSRLEQFADYEETRDDPNQATTLLSAHNKFGTLSPREVYGRITDRFGETSTLATQMVWRDFYYYHLYRNPDNLERSFSDTRWDDQFSWRLGLRDFRDYQSGRLNKGLGPELERYEAWCQGRTGVPIVDAGIRQLRSTGYMHNRCRMIVAMFLTKNLAFHWKWGERFFATMLTDYDPALNVGNWQWCSGCGVDPLRYGKPRIFNCWSQGREADPEASYIKTWIPELKTVPASKIHNWDKHHAKYSETGYPAPIADHAETRKRFLDEFDRVFS
jgi:deoxyribodipyrimidine photo-lyase